MRLVYPLILKYQIVLCIRMLLVWVLESLDVWGRLRPKIRFLFRLIRCDLLLLPKRCCWLRGMLIRTNCRLKIQLAAGLRP